MTRPVFLVGSVPYEPAEVFERAGETLRGLVGRIPDGELKGWLPAADFREMAGVVEGRGESISGPPFNKTVRAAEGQDIRALRFDTLHYAPNAIASYALFRQAKAEGKVEPGVRFQVSIPTPFTGLITWDYDQLRAIWPVYEAALLGEVTKMMAAIPPEDLAISWDCCEFVMTLANPHAPERWSMEELAAGVARCLDATPAPAEAGLHFCYGGYNSAGTGDDPLDRKIEDTGLMVDFFHAIRDATRRPINWLHMPVPRQREDDGYFAPLDRLQPAAETELYLGLIYLEDGLEGTRRKVEAACRHLHGFGVAAACGLNNPGASSREGHTQEMLEQHRLVAEAL
jgi:hypothetical protein